MSKLRPFAWGSALALLVCLCGATARAADDPDKEARERYENAIKLYEDGAFDAALVELNRAAELRPSYKIFYNIGQVRFAMHDYAAAIDAYRQYLDKGGEKIAPARRDQVQKELVALEQRVAKVTIETDVPGAAVFVDDTPVGTTPLVAPVVVNSGIRRISVRHPDYVPQSRRLSIAGGDQNTIKFALTDQSGSAAAPATTAQPAAPAAAGTPSSTPRVIPARPKSPRSEPAQTPQTAHASPNHVPWLGWTLTGAFAAGAAVTGVITLKKNSSLSSDRQNLSVSPSQVSSRASTVRTLATVTDALAAAALISGGVSLWLTLRSSENAAAPRANLASNTLRLGLGPSGVSLDGAF